MPVEPVVDFLAGLAGGGAALEFGHRHGPGRGAAGRAGCRVRGIDLSPDMVEKLGGEARRGGDRRRDVDGKKPIQIISSYRSPATNAMLRRRSSAVARFSQHMLGHAMDFYIPDVPLEQIRFAGLRLQRGGVGFYPASGSPFVHLDTGGIRHWPRMTHDQLARVFPDGRTVHIPSDGNPLAGMSWPAPRSKTAAATTPRPKAGRAVSSPPCSASDPKSNDDEDEGVSAAEKAVPARLMASTASAKSAEPVPIPRAKPTIAGTFQLASADAQLIQRSKLKPSPSSQTTETEPQTPADIINARGFWDDAGATPQLATPAQVVANAARRALAAADPPSTASVSSALQALAYAPAASSLVDHSNIVTASAPIPAASGAPLPRAARPPLPRSTPWLPRGRRVRTIWSLHRRGLRPPPEVTISGCG